MAYFNIAIAITLKNEGGYANDPNDSGGETHAGVSRKNFPLWKGWEIIDQYADYKKTPKELNKILAKIPELISLIHALYETSFWDVIKGYEINAQGIANKLFDVSVNIGCFHGIKCIQMAIYDLGQELHIDGIMGEKTIAAINKCDPVVLLNKFRNEVAEYYAQLKKPKNYIDAWIKRLYS